MPRSPVTTLDDLRDAWPDLRDATLIGLDLREAGLDWTRAEVHRTTFLACRLRQHDSEFVAARGAAVLSELPSLPFTPYRADLYSYEELTSGHEVDGWQTTLDARLSAWFASASTDMFDGLVRALHDATIDAAVARFVRDRHMVGVMGGHALDRDAPRYRFLAQVGRSLTRAGFCIATGGGPGVMEAANLGAWFAPFADDEMEQALGLLARAPSYETDPDTYIRRTLDVRTRWPDGGESLGVPTWVYVNEPTSGFATHIAKYFTNSIREDGLLAVARSGVVYGPGSAGTEQEIFTDIAQNSLTLYKVRSPVVFVDSDYFERERPELVTAVRRQAEVYGWSDLVAVCDDPDRVVSFIAQHDPDRAGGAGVDRRRRHRTA